MALRAWNFERSLRRGMADAAAGRVYAWDDLKAEWDHERTSQHWAWRLARRLYVNRQSVWNRWVRRAAGRVDGSTPKVRYVERQTGERA